MTDIVNFKGVVSKVYRKNSKVFVLLVVAAATALLFSACPGGEAGNPAGGDPNNVDANEVAATVNGEDIKLVEVERILKQQGQGEEKRLSPLELTAARLTVLQSLIQNEVLFQRAQKENTVPTDEEVTAELNKIKQGSGQSQEQWKEGLEKLGESEDTFKNTLKKELAIRKLIDKITAKVEPPTEKDIEAFFKSNPESFKNKRGAQLGAIVITPGETVQGDPTKDQVSAQQKAKEVGSRILRDRADFATVARETSEEPNTRLSGGEWRYFTEEEMKQTFGDGFADYVMNKMDVGQIIPQAIPLEGNFLIVKLQRRQEKDEDLTLESPKVREQITAYLTNQRKELLRQSFAAVAMNEAKIENYLANKVVSNPNELSGMRPAPVSDANANTAASDKPETDNNAAENTNAANDNAAATDEKKEETKDANTGK